MVAEGYGEVVEPVETYESRKRSFPTLGPITFERVGEGSEWEPHRIALTMTFYSPGRDEEMVLEFDDVVLEKFALPTSFSDVELLTIHSIADRGWEAARYRVLDIEQDWLAFLCRSFAVSVRTAATDRV